MPKLKDTKVTPSEPSVAATGTRDVSLSTFVRVFNIDVGNQTNDTVLLNPTEGVPSSPGA